MDEEQIRPEHAYFPGPVQKEGTELRVLAYILALTAIISYIDIITPQGFTIWILYMIPLFLTLYVRWPYAPFTATGIFILLMGVSFFLSPVDISMTFALSDRIFFSLALIVASFFIWNYNHNVSALRKHEVRYRQLAESSPDTIMVLLDGKIVYINPAGLRLFAADRCNDIINKEFPVLLVPEERERMRDHMTEVMKGKRTPLYETRLMRLDMSEVRAETFDEKILWDGQPAVQVILREMD